MNSVISDTPGPEVAVKARAPFQPAPITMPMGQLVLGLHDGIVVLTGGGVNAELGAVLLERLGNRGRRGDRVPGGHRGAAIHQAQSRGAVAVGKNLVTHVVGSLHPHTQRRLHVLLDVVAPQVQRLHVGLKQRSLPLYCSAKSFSNTSASTSSSTDSAPT
jgi:hypothetical protein